MNLPQKPYARRLDRRMPTTTEIGLGLLWYAVFVVSTALHEAAHAWTAFRFGDSTAYDAGLVTLDPLPHIQRSPFGMVIIPILSFFSGGWLIGWASTPYDPSWAHHNRRKAALMALSGPAANLLLVLVAALLIRGGMLLGWLAKPDTVLFAHIVDGNGTGLADGFATLVSIMFSLNLLLFVFNLLPLPPLDGSSVITLFFSAKLTQQYYALIAQPAFQMVGLIVAWRAMNFILLPVWLFALRLLYF
jgi:Zn-dependent protease